MNNSRKRSSGEAAFQDQEQHYARPYKRPDPGLRRKKSSKALSAETADRTATPLLAQGRAKALNQQWLLWLEPLSVLSSETSAKRYDVSEQEDQEGLKFSNLRTRLIETLDQQENEIPSHAKTTCEWLQEEDAYKRWRSALANTCPVLLLMGERGYGKSVLVRAVSATLLDMKVFKFFCNRSGRSRRKFSTVLATFLMLMLLEIDDPDLRHHRRNPEQFRPGDAQETALIKLFEDLLKYDEMRSVVLIIDGLDACSPKDQRMFKRLLEIVLANNCPRTLVTSRKTELARLLYDDERVGSVSIDKDAVRSDVNACIQSRLGSSILGPLGQSDALQQIAECVAETVDGYFLVITTKLKQFDQLRRRYPGRDTLPQLLELLRDLGPLNDLHMDNLKDLLLANNKDINCVCKTLSVLLAVDGAIDLRTLDLILHFAVLDVDSQNHGFEPRSADGIREYLERTGGDFVHVQKSHDMWTANIQHDSGREFFASLDQQQQLASEYEQLAISKTQGHYLISKASMLVFKLHSAHLVTPTGLSYLLLGIISHIRLSEAYIQQYLPLLAHLLAPSNELLEFIIKLDFAQDFDSSWGAWPDDLPEFLRSPIGFIIRHRLDNVLMAMRPSPRLGYALLHDLEIDLRGEIGTDITLLQALVSLQYESAIATLLQLGAFPKWTVPNAGFVEFTLCMSRVLSGDPFNPTIVEALLIMGADPCGTGSSGQCLLSIAIGSCFEFATPLLEAKADPFYRTRDGGNILHDVTRADRVDFLIVLFERYELNELIPLILEADSFGYTPMHYATFYSDSIFWYFRVVLGDGTRSGPHHDLLLYHATDSDKPAIVSALLSDDTNVDMRHEGHSPATVAVYNGFLECGRLLLDRGADPNQRSPEGSPLLHMAINRGRSNLANLLLQQSGIDREQRDADGDTALICACRGSMWDIAERLVLDQVDTTAAGMKGMTALHLAAAKGQLGLVRSLVRRRELQDPKSPLYIDERFDGDSLTPLLAACLGSHKDVILFLLQKKADYTYLTAENNNMISCCFTHVNDEQFVLELLKDYAKEDYNMASVHGVQKDTLLHIASRRGWITVISLLLQRGASTTAFNTNGETPLYTTTVNGHDDCAALLLKHPAMLHARTMMRSSHLDAAAFSSAGAAILDNMLASMDFKVQRKSLATLAGYILENGDAMKFEVFKHRTARMYPLLLDTEWSILHSSALIGRSDLIDEFVQKEHHTSGAELVTSRIRTPFYIACSQGHGDAAHKLINHTARFLIPEPQDLTTDLHAACDRLPEIALLLIDKFHLPISIKTARNHTPLSLACREDHRELVNRLLEHPSIERILNLQTTFRRYSPIHLALVHNHIECAIMLIKRGADLLLSDFFGNTAFDLATKSAEVFQRFCDACEDYPVQKQAKLSWQQSRIRRHLRNQSQYTYPLAYLLSWIQTKHNGELNSLQPIDRGEMNILLSIGLSRLGLHEDSETALELALFQRPGKDPVQGLCDSCEDRAADALYFCHVCYDWTICSKCHKLQKDTESSCCYNHGFSKLPRDDWSSRDSEVVNPAGESEKEWLTRLIRDYSDCEAYKRRSDPNIVPCLAIENELDLQKLQDLFKEHNLNALDDALWQDPRWVWCEAADKTSITATGLNTVMSDDEGKLVLNILHQHGAKLLTQDKDGRSTIEIGLDRGLHSCVDILLGVWDHEFDRTNKSGPLVMKRLIALQQPDMIGKCLSRHYEWAIRDEFAWVDDFVDSGMELDDVADLLIHFQEKSSEDTDPKRHARPVTVFDVPANDWSNVVDLGPPPIHFDTLPTRGKHIGNCCHAVFYDQSPANNTTDRASDDIVRPESSPVRYELVQEYQEASAQELSVPPERFFDGFCIDHMEMKDTSADHARFDSIFGELTFADLSHTEHRANPGIRSACEALLRAMSMAQAYQLCCERMFVLYYGSIDGYTAIRCHPVMFQEVLDFHQSLIQGLDNRSSLDECLIIARRTLDPIGFDPSSSKASVDTFTSELCSIVVQIWTLALRFTILGYGKHSLAAGETEIFGVEILLYGHATDPLADLKSYKMACIGDMVNDDILAFSLLSQATGKAPSNENSGLGLAVTAEQAAQLFGRGVYRFARRGHRALRSLAVLGGFIYATGRQVSGFKEAHWLPSIDFITATAGESRYETFDPNEYLHIAGDVQRSSHDCPGCNHRNHSRLFDAALLQGLITLGGQDSFWQAATRQTTASLGFSAHYVTGSVAFAWGRARKAGTNHKTGIMNEWLEGIPEALIQSCGIQFNVHNGLARRVPIRKVLGEVIQPYISRAPPRNVHLKLPQPADWNREVERLIRRLKGETGNIRTDDAKFCSYINSLARDEPESSVAQYIQHAITYMLALLGHTGVSEDGRYFKTLWSIETRPLDLHKAYRFEISDAPWVKTLADTAEMATYAVVIRDCHEGLIPDTLHRCFSHRMGHAPIPIRALDTMILPMNPSLKYRYQMKSPFVLEAGAPHMFVVGQNDEAREFVLRCHEINGEFYLVFFKTWRQATSIVDACKRKIGTELLGLRENKSYAGSKLAAKGFVAIMCSVDTFRELLEHIKLRGSA